MLEALGSQHQGIHHFTSVRLPVCIEASLSIKAQAEPPPASALPLLLLLSLAGGYASFWAWAPACATLGSLRRKTQVTLCLYLEAGGESRGGDSMGSLIRVACCQRGDIACPSLRRRGLCGRMHASLLFHLLFSGLKAQEAKLGVLTPVSAVKRVSIHLAGQRFLH